MKDTLRQAVSRAEVVKVRNALNPLLWLSAVVTPSFLTAAGLAGFENVSSLFLIAFASIPPIAALIGYFLLLFRDPDRLQSEEYLLRREELLILSKAGDRNDPTNMEAIGNPAAKGLGAGEETAD